MYNIPTGGSNFHFTTAGAAGGSAAVNQHASEREFQIEY